MTPIVGPGNVSTQVNIDIDFTKSEITEEIVDPDGTALRSEQSTLDLTTDLPAKGIPGAGKILSMNARVVSLLAAPSHC